MNPWGWKRSEKKRLLQLAGHFRYIHLKNEDTGVHKQGIICPRLHKSEKLSGSKAPTTLLCNCVTHKCSQLTMEHVERIDYFTSWEKKRETKTHFFSSSLSLFFSFVLVNPFKISFWALWKTSLHRMSLHLMNAGNLTLTEVQKGIAGMYLVELSYHLVTLTHSKTSLERECIFL